jgi:hypothetical protein
MTTTGSLRGLLTARDVNSFRPDPNTFGTDSSAAGAPIPVAFGSVSVPGIISLSGVDGSGDGIFRVFWCHGEIYQIDSVFINDAAPPASVEIRHYRGTIHQGIDDLVESITTLVSYTETMVKDNPAGLSAVAYSVFRIPAGAISGSPRFQAILRGSVVYDVRSSLVSDYIYDDVVTYNLDFYAAGVTSGTPTTGVDLSSYAHTVTWSGNAQLSSGLALFDGNGDYLTLQDTTAADFGTGKWTLEVTAETTDTTGTQHIFSKGDAASDRAIILSIIGDDLYVSMSSTGTTWDIASVVLLQNTFSPTTSAVASRITIEYTEREYHFYVNGFHVHVIQDDSPLYATTRPVRLGLYDGGTATDGFNGKIWGCRLTKGVNRYGGVHGTIVAPNQLTYQDIANYRPGYVYSATPALALGELARNPFYGLGVETVNNELEAIEFNEELLPSAVARAEFGLVLSSVRATEDWMDLVASYAECFWFFDSDGIYIKPDRLVTAERPAGWEMGENGELLVDASAWTVGTGWTYFGSDLNLFSAAAGSASAVSQAMVKPFEAGVTYTAIMDVGLRSAGTVSLTLSGITLIAAVSAAGRYAYEFTATGGEDGLTLSCNKDSAFVGLIGEITIKRKYWPETSIVRGSLTISGQPNSDSPTSVQVQYTIPSTTSANWLDAVTTAQMPGVDVGDVPILETNIEFRGVQRIEEAENKALSRLLRLQNMVAVSWVSTDIGIAFRRGFVVEVTDPETATTVMVLVDSVTATNDAGRYRVTGMRYDESHYPSETELPAATIPVGAITISRDGVVPSGWSLFSGANGKWIKGAGAGVTAETTGGAATLAALSGDTEDSPPHGDDYVPFWFDGFESTGGSGSGYLYTSTEESVAGHHHTYNTGTITPQPYSAECVLVEKITSTTTTMPGNLLTFGKAGLTSRNTTRWLYAAGRLLKAAAAAAVSGIKEQAITLTTGSTPDTHEHYTRTATSSGTPSVTSANSGVFEYANGGGAHTHPATIGLNQNTQRYRLSLYGATADYGLQQGHMVMLKNIAIPTDWTLCNGLLGTPDLEDYFVELAAMGEEDTTAGDNTLEVFGYTNYSAKHKHYGVLDAASYNPLAASHLDEVRHRHVIYSTGHAWQPPWYALSMIMYNPNPVPGYPDALLLISGGEADGSTTLVDDSTHARSATVTGGTGSLQYDDAQTLFGLTTVNINAHKVYFSTLSLPTKFTCEGFFRLNSVSGGNMQLLSNLGSGAGTFVVRFTDSSNAIDLLVDGTLRKTGITVAADQWFYVSVSYDYANWYFHTGLVSTGLATLASGTPFAQASNAMDAGFYVGGTTTAGTMKGFFSQIRVTGGVAMNKNSAIVIPQAPFATS